MKISILNLAKMEENREVKAYGMQWKFIWYAYVYNKVTHGWKIIAQLLMIWLLLSRCRMYGRIEAEYVAMNILLFMISWINQLKLKEFGVTAAATWQWNKVDDINLLSTLYWLLFTWHQRHQQLMTGMQTSLPLSCQNK